MRANLELAALQSRRGRVLTRRQPLRQPPVGQQADRNRGLDQERRHGGDVRGSLSNVPIPGPSEVALLRRRSGLYDRSSRGARPRLPRRPHSTLRNAPNSARVRNRDHPLQGPYYWQWRCAGGLANHGEILALIDRRQDSGSEAQ